MRVRYEINILENKIFAQIRNFINLFAEYIIWINEQTLRYSPTYFKYLKAVRRLIYTTNAIERFNCQLQNVRKSKTVFSFDESLPKILYSAMMDSTKNRLESDRVGNRSIHRWKYF